jgi:hypothetical protein
MFTHNVAILRETDSKRGGYVMMGGKQAFVSNATCRLEHKNELHARSACLQPDRSSGIRLSRGDAMPWSAARWSPPTPVVSGVYPSGCVDRRPRSTGWPRQIACEFDGRLSVVRSGGSYLLYARANLRYGAIAGGRFVQVSQSQKLDEGWQKWQMVHIEALDVSKVDVYTFAVQPNPVDPHGSLLAIFPLTEPPWACVAFAVSIDGVHFSRPVMLRRAEFGVRMSEGGQREWRGEDHPVAGIVRAPTRPGQLLIYIYPSRSEGHTTARQGAVPHVRAYTFAEADLKRETATGKAALLRRGHGRASRSAWIK